MTVAPLRFLQRGAASTSPPRDKRQVEGANKDKGEEEEEDVRSQLTAP